MRTTFFKFSCLLTTAILLLSACNLPVNDASPEPGQSTTNDVATVELGQATSTKTPAKTATETQPSEPSATATAEAPMAEVGRESNCRTGPGGLYDLVATYQAGQMVEVVAKDLGGGYWFVKNPDKPEEQCYLLANNITVSGDTSALPQFTPLPSPLAPPFFKVNFKKFDTCEAQDFAIFTVENTGSVPFRSSYIKVTDTKSNKSVEQALNAFDLRAHCVLVKNIAPLNSGESGYVNSLYFSSGMSEKKLRATIMLCTEQNLKGNCVTQSLDVKP
jgi:hypothetical protein